jgi:hypothetical protein
LDLALGQHLVLVEFQLALILAMRCLILLKRLAVVLMPLLSVTHTPQHLLLQTQVTLTLQAAFRQATLTLVPAMVDLFSLLGQSRVLLLELVWPLPLPQLVPLALMPTTSRTSLYTCGRGLRDYTSLQ